MPRTYKVDNEIYDIEDNDVESFLKDMPNAIEVQSFVVDKDTFDIPVNDVEAFLKDMPNAKPLKGAEPVGGATSGQGSNAPTTPSSSKIKDLTARAVAGDETAKQELVALKGATQAKPKEKEFPIQTDEQLKQVSGQEIGKETPKSPFKAPEIQESTKALAYGDKKGYKQTVAKIAEGQHDFTDIENDYIASLEFSTPEKREYETQKLNEIRSKTELTDADKDYLNEIRSKAIEGYRESEKVYLNELDRKYGFKEFQSRLTPIVSQQEVLKKEKAKIQSQSTVPSDQQQTRLMEIDATLQRLGEKAQGLVSQYNIPQEVLQDVGVSYRNLGELSVANESNMNVFGHKANQLKAEINDKYRAENENGIEKFLNATSSIVASGAVGVSQIPKVMGDMVGDVDYDRFDKWYDEAQKAKTNVNETLGRTSGFDDLSFWQKLPTYIGEGVGSMTLLAGGGEVLGGGSLGISSAAFLTSEADYYQQAIELGIPQAEAARQAALIAAVTSAIETVVKDTEYFDPKVATRSVLASYKAGNGFKESMTNVFKEFVPALTEYGKRTGIGAAKEGGEEFLGQIGESATQSAINAYTGQELYQDTFNPKDIAEAITVGAVSGGAGNFVGRGLASRRSPVQESFISDIAANPSVLENIEATPENEELIDVAKEASKIQSRWEQLPHFNKLDENVKAHIVSESLRAKQLEKARKEAGADESVIADQIDEINQNVLFAQNNNAIRGEEKQNNKSLKDLAVEAIKESSDDDEEKKNNRRVDLFPETSEFSSVIGGSDVESKLSKYKEVNGIGFSEYSNPKTGDVDVIMTGTSDHDFVGFVRIYENGKPTNKWTSKFENKSGNKQDFKTMISEAQKMLPKGHEYTEKTSISTDGLRVFAQQLERGYELQYDEKGNLITNEVAINGDSKVNDLGINVSSGNFENISVSNNKDFAKVKEALKPYLEKFGLTDKDIIWEDGTVKINLPVLKQQPNGKENESGVRGDERGGEAPVEAQPNEGTSPSEAETSGVVQEPQEEVAPEETPVQAEEEAVQAEAERDAVVEEVKTAHPDLTETEAEDVADYSAIHDVTTEEAVAAVKEIHADEAFTKLGVQETGTEAKSEQAPTNGSRVELEPQIAGAPNRVMVFEDGEWKEKVGGTTTRVSEAMQAKAQAKFAEATPEVTPVVEEVAQAEQQEEQDVFTALDAEMEGDTEQAKAVRKDNKAKFGQAYKRAVKITKSFNNIVERLESEGKLKKECP